VNPIRRFLAAAAGAACLLAASTPQAATPVLPPTVPAGGGRLLLEGGWAVPLGDLDDRFDATPRSAGARPGFELGLRWRLGLDPVWSVAPSLHFLGYGDAKGLGDDGEDSLAPGSLRYGVELLAASAREGLQPFVGLEPCIVHSRLKGPGKDHITLMDASSTGLGTLGARRRAAGRPRVQRRLPREPLPLVRLLPRPEREVVQLGHGRPEDRLAPALGRLRPSRQQEPPAPVTGAGGFLFARWGRDRR
jgi:hypothetical protein